jgi:hypothetical protein
MGMDKTTFVVVLCGGATEVTWLEVTLVTWRMWWPEVTEVSALVVPYDRKSIQTDVTGSDPDRNRKYVLRMSSFSPALFS